MTKLRILLSSLVVWLVFATVPSVTRAYDGWAGSLGDVPAFGYSGSLYGLGYLPVPPYFAVHPPVYYGERYYRTYGESPYARPARSSRPLRVSAQVIINPFVEQAAAGLARDPSPRRTGRGGGPGDLAAASHHQPLLQDRRSRPEIGSGRWAHRSWTRQGSAAAHSACRSRTRSCFVIRRRQSAASVWTRQGSAAAHSACRFR